MLETRNIELALPRAGDEVVWLGADIAIAIVPPVTALAFVKATGQMLSIHDSVGVAMDLDARRAIPIPPSIRAAMEPHYLPEFA